ncbi:MAG: Crp/Fnr family transcriptional regulator [Deltaproteobacteria bacterium]|nr:Crp/Fnr family transcriptional regulator [Deltaproteobacteria bacterium]MBW2070350.1 Crp/Fnr family transcriptional regulator [Deltaproteobacteria bacterium]
MKREQLVQELRSAELFRDLSPEHLQALAGIARLRQLAPGEMLFAAGEPARGFFVLLQGKIKLSKISADGKEYVLRMVRPGQTFAEAAAFSGGTYPVYAESIAAGRLVFFGKEEFGSLVERTPQLALNMIATMAELLQRLNISIEDLSLREVAARLCRHLLARARQQHGQVTDGISVALETSKSTLASRLGTVSETLSRTFRRLQQQQLLKVGRNQVQLLDCERLQRVADGELKL